MPNEFLTCMAAGITDTEKMIHSVYCHNLIFKGNWWYSNPQTANSKMKTFALQTTAFWRVWKGHSGLKLGYALNGSY